MKMPERWTMQKQGTAMEALEVASQMARSAAADFPTG
jgi:hypothetical protein